MTDTVYISVGAGPDLAAIINAALADPSVGTVILEPGLFLLHSPIVIPSGKTLLGSGRGETLIRAAADFSIVSPSHNAVILSDDYASNITLSDLTIDAAKIFVDGLRLNGVFMRYATEFLVARIDVENATGYANYAAGDLGSYQAGNLDAVQASGRYEDVNTFNAQIHFEQIFANGITLFNVHARDGDGDISTEAYFHPIIGSENITYEQSSAYGSGFLGFSLISGYLPLNNIRIIDTQVEIIGPSQGSALIALGALPVNGLYIEDSSFIAHNYIAFRIGGVTGTAANSYFQGGLFALEVTTSGDGTASDFDVTDSDALGVRDATSGVGVAGVHSDQASYLSWTGGSIEARAGLMFPVSGAATLSPTTQLISDGHDITISYTEGGSDIPLFASGNFALAGSPNLDGATLTANYLAHETAADRLFLAEIGPIDVNGSTVSYGGTVIGAINGGANGSALVITLNASATPAIAEALLDNIYFRNTSGNSGSTARLMSAGLQLAGGGYSEVTASLTVIGTANVPANAVADTGATGEDATLLLDLLANDSDPDARLDTITQVNGLTIASGSSFALPSGALVTLTAGGQLLYDPNGAYDFLVAEGSGATNSSSATDSFTYTLSGGSSAGVQITIDGIASSGDVLIGDGAANNIHASAIDQYLQGLAGADALYDEGFAVTLEGGTENDSYYVGNAATLLVEATNAGIDQVRTTASLFTLGANLENLYFTGTSGRFTGYGNALDNVVEGGAQGDFLFGFVGNDILRGGAGADVLDGGAGHDVLDGGASGDAMIGGSGNDIFYVDSANDIVIEGADPGFDTIFTTLATYTLANWVENLSFSGTGNFNGTGNPVGNEMTGSIGNDTLSGMDGDDRLIGFGGADVLNGGNGNDLLQGGTGSDQLTGGAGADRFRVDTALSASNVDNITDFVSGTDKIELSRAVFSALGLGALPESAFSVGSAGGSIEDPDDRIIYDPETGSIYYDPDGGGGVAPILFARLAPNTSLDAGDFVIV